jgi:hypothetical protein
MLARPDWNGDTTLISAYHHRQEPAILWNAQLAYTEQGPNMTDTDAIAADRSATQRRGLTLAQYVRRRNGVPLGAPGSLQNMLRRSLGAGTFAEFWQYWNPIWGYALGRYIYAPLRKLLPVALALVLTFAISGALHDAAATLVKRTPAILFTPWFLLMGLLVIVGQVLKIEYAQSPFAMRVAINLAFILGSLLVTLLLMPG